MGRFVEERAKGASKDWDKAKPVGTAVLVFVPMNEGIEDACEGFEGFKMAGGGRHVCGSHNARRCYNSNMIGRAVI